MSTFEAELFAVKDTDECRVVAVCCVEVDGILVVVVFSCNAVEESEKFELVDFVVVFVEVLVVVRSAAEVLVSEVVWSCVAGTGVLDVKLVSALLVVVAEPWVVV